MNTTGRIGRGLAAAGTIAALTAGGLLAAAPVSAAVQGDRIVGPMYSLSSWTLVNQPIGNNVGVAATGLTTEKIIAAWEGSSSRATFSRPAPGTSGPVILEDTGKCAQANSATVLVWAECDGSLAQQFTTVDLPTKTPTPFMQYNSDAYPSYGLSMNTTGTTGRITLYTKGSSAMWYREPDSYEVIKAEAEVILTSPGQDTEVGAKGATFTGTATPSQDVVITDAEGSELATVTADASGAWQQTLQLPTGPVTLTFTSGSKMARWSGLVIDDTAEIVLSSPTTGDKVVGSGVLFEGTAEPGATVSILDAEGNEVGTAVADATTGVFSVEVVLPEGSTSASVVVGERKVDVNDLAVVAELKVTKPAADATIGTNGTEFAGTGEPGDTVEIKDADGKTLGTADVDEFGNWTVKVKVPEGAAPITVTAGGQTVVLEDVTVEDDTAPLVITTPGADDELVGPDVTFGGTGQPGETVEIFDNDGKSLGSTEVRPDGSWDLTVSLPDGGSVTVEAGDQKVTVEDLAVIAPLEITSPKAGDKIGTNGADFTGKGEPGESVVIRDSEGNELGSTTVKPDGSWELNVVVPEGAAPIRVTAGNQTVVLEDVAVEDDTAELTITSPAEGAQVPLSGFTITGTAQPLAEVEVREAAVARAAGDLVGTATANAQGVWTLNVQLPVGDAALVFTAPGKTASLNVTVFDDTPEEIAPLVVTSPASGDTITDATATFEGTAAGGATVELKDADGKVLAETVANPDGSWSIAYALPAGKATYVIAAGGETVTLTDLVSVRNDAPVFEFAITSPAEGETVGTGDITFAGTGVPDSVIVIRDAEGNPLGDTTVGTDGTWTLVIPAMPEGEQSIVVNDGEKDITFDFVVVEDEESTPLMDPLLGGTIAAGLLAFAGAFGLRRRFTATAE